jgi:hypothetical protein
MPLPPTFREAIQSKDFWVEYILDRIEGPEWPALGRRCRVEVPVGRGYGLILDLSRFLFETVLSLRCPGRRQPLRMGHNDLACWTPDVLRWPEAILFSRAAARLDRELHHPGLVLALLYQFTPLTAADSRRAVWSLMRQAFGSLGVLSGRAVERCLRESTSDLRSHFTWRQEPYGWVLQGLRGGCLFPRAPKGLFPFHEFGAAVQAAEQTCG